MATLSIANTSALEGNSGTQSMPFTLTLSNPVDSAVTVVFATADDPTMGAIQATAGTDYSSVSNTVVTFNPGDVSKTINVSINGDTTVELNQTFQAFLSNLNNGGRSVTLSGSTAIGTITNDDSATLSITGNSVAEGNSGSSTNLNLFTINLSQPADVPVTVHVSTADDTAVASFRTPAAITRP